MRTAKNRFAITAGLAGLLLLGGLPLPAQESRDFTFHVDPLAIGFLDTDVDSDSAKFNEYRDLSSGFIGALRLTGDGGDRTFDVSADHISRDDARYTIRYGVAGRYGILFDYNKIPHDFGTGHMLFTHTAPGRYEIADPVQGALQNAITQQFTTNRNGVTFQFLNGLLAPYLATAQAVDLGLERNRTLAKIDLGQMGPLAWGLTYRHENRQGNRPYGASFGFNNVTELPEPIDYDTDDAVLAGELNGRNGGLRFGYRYSTFENHVDTLIWDNPFRLTPSTDASAYQAPSSSSINGSNLGIADLAPDNRANMLFADGRTRLGANWWVNGSASYNVMTQDDPLLPYTLNRSIVGIAENGATFDPTNPANLPRRNADEEVDVLNFNGNAGTRFGDNLSLTLRYRYYDYDNQSSRIEFPGYVRFHAVWEDIARISVPYAYTRQDASAELDWEVFKASTLGFGYKLQTWDRELREVQSSDENIFFVSFDTRPRNWFDVRARYEIGDRSIDGYDPEAALASFVEAEAVSNPPDLRKFAQAERQYAEYRLEANVFPWEAWNFAFGVSGRNEDYDESTLGLIDDDILQLNAEVSYAPGENLNFYLFGNRSDRDSFQRARQSGATPSTRPIDNWELDIDEANDMWGLGVTSTFATRWTGNVEGRWSRSEGFADFTAFPGGLPLAGPPARPAPQDFGNYEDYELLALIGKLDYRITPQATARFLYRYEDYTIDSFIIQDLRNYLPGALLLNPNFGDYTANILGLELRLAF